jgi:hypothetical protein
VTKGHPVSDPEKIDGPIELQGSPKFIIRSRKPLRLEVLHRITEDWKRAVNAGAPVILDSEFEIFAMNAAGKWALLDSSQVLP